MPEKQAGNYFLNISNFFMLWYCNCWFINICNNFIFYTFLKQLIYFIDIFLLFDDTYFILLLTYNMDNNSFMF